MAGRGWTRLLADGVLLVLSERLVDGVVIVFETVVEVICPLEEVGNTGIRKGEGGGIGWIRFETSAGIAVEITFDAVFDKAFPPLRDASVLVVPGGAKAE